MICASPPRGSARHSTRTPIEWDAASHEVDGHVFPGVRDRVLLAPERDRLLRLQAAVGEFVEEDEEPALAGERRRGVVGGERLEHDEGLMEKAGGAFNKVRKRLHDWGIFTTVAGAGTAGSSSPPVCASALLPSAKPAPDVTAFHPQPPRCR